MQKQKSTMKKLLLLILLIPLFSGAQNATPVPFVDGKVQFETVLEVKNKTAKSLYSDVKLMISEIYKSGKAVIDASDDEGLFIVVKGNTRYPLTDFLGTVYVTLDHSIKFQFKDERMKIVFSNLVVNTIPFECIAEECKGYKFNKKIRQQHIDQVIGIWDGLQKTILDKLEKSKNDNW